ncbi:MAG: hypothetical protein KDE22_16590 [Rhodobacterales bacterium]|nr:hypothetical protein [Rhodobacterales bacterium]
MDQQELRLRPEPRQEPKQPIMGYASVAFGILGIFFSVWFVPFGFLCSVIALFLGQVVWAFLGLILAFIGVITSPTLLFAIGLGAVATWLGLS